MTLNTESFEMICNVRTQLLVLGVIINRFNIKVSTETLGTSFARVNTVLLRVYDTMHLIHVNEHAKQGCALHTALLFCQPILTAEECSQSIISTSFIHPSGSLGAHMRIRHVSCPQGNLTPVVGV